MVLTKILGEALQKIKKEEELEASLDEKPNSGSSTKEAGASS